MAESEPKIRIDDREELIYLLAEAAAIESNVMASYLYAAWSLKRGERDGLTPEQAVAVKQWKDAVYSVAIEEMTHLTLACNLACSIGGGPHLSHPPYPIRPGYHPSGLVIELRGFSLDVLDHFIFIERPEGKELHDASEFVHPHEYHRAQPRGRVMPSAQDYATVGHLYRAIRHGFERLDHHLGEADLFCGDPSTQLGPGDMPLPELTVVTDLKSAEDAIQTIIEQGEGAPAHSEDSHYQRFVNVRQQYHDFLAENPDFEPAFPVAHNPTMRPPMDGEDCVFVSEPEAARVLDLANACYGQMLRCLVQAWGRHADDAPHKRMLAQTAREIMSILDKLGPHLASLPASKHHPGVNAGMTFTMLRDIQRMPTGPGEMRMLAERTIELADHARRVFPKGHEFEALGDTLMQIAGNFDVQTGRARVEKPKPEFHVHDVPLREGAVECAEGTDLTVNFAARRCIHARFCVLGAPRVFKANTPGEWIFPDEMETSELVHVIKNCPSGALTYDPKGDLAAEGPPPVNTVHLREAGPYAFHAPLKLNGEEIGFRATLCRCGASRHKPFCDSTHHDIGFHATGEPDTRSTDPLKVRDGELAIDPEPNGPLVVTGNLEICAGTGRTIDRVTSARLCRCGGSKTKPFCDNTHLKIGFEAD